ncbi:hypothetical protein F4774DRAFT_424592 [Daldinia eschscholtzii]|nr:hypothetical protein F4774DRAFT_424592 [Daldinia eschscholtzii]
MPSPPSQESTSRTPRPTEEEPTRRKRYSLIVELLDDDGFEVLERQREEADRPRTLNRGTSTSRHRHNESSNINRQSRRMSTPPNVAEVGPRDHNVHALERLRRAGARSRASHTSEHTDEVYETATELRSSSHIQRQRSSTHSSSTQTHIRGYGPRSIFTSPYNLFRPNHHHRRDLDAMEAAYRDGLRLGQRLANLHDFNNPYRIHPPRPVPESPVRIVDRNEQSDTNSWRRRRENPEQRGWRCLFPPWLFGNARGPPTRVELSSSSSRSRGHRG